MERNIPERTIIIFNITVLFLFTMLKDVNLAVLDNILAAAFIICVVSLLVHMFNKNRRSNILLHIQVAVSSVIVCFIVLEIINIVIPGVFPKNIRRYMLAKKRLDHNVEVILDRSPYVKFRPNSTVHYLGHRGSDDQFVYEWKTDRYGFKNPAGIFDMEIRCIALGNSFTEGMGVRTGDTWPSILTEKGVPAYNMGVKGYSPSQMEGVLREYGSGFDPDYIVIGYFAGSYEREKESKKKERALKYTKNYRTVLNDIRKFIGRRSITNAIFKMIKVGLEENKDDRSGWIKIEDKIFEKYLGELSAFEKESFSPEDDSYRSKEWQDTLAAFINIKELAGRLKAKTVLLYFPRRERVYYVRAAAESLPENHVEKTETGLLKVFCKDNDILFVDPTIRITEYVNNMEPGDGFPYLVFDGHMSRTGYELVVEELLGYLEPEKEL